jgi:hypothetical protein
VVRALYMPVPLCLPSPASMEPGRLWHLPTRIKPFLLRCVACRPGRYALPTGYTAQLAPFFSARDAFLLIVAGPPPAVHRQRCVATVAFRSATATRRAALGAQAGAMRSADTLAGAAGAADVRAGLAAGVAAGRGLLAAQPPAAEPPGGELPSLPASGASPPPTPTNRSAATVVPLAGQRSFTARVDRTSCSLHACMLSRHARSRCTGQGAGCGAACVAAARPSVLCRSPEQANRA